MSTLKKRIWFVTNGTAKHFYSAPNVREAEAKGREHAVATGWKQAQLWECTNKEICRNEDLPLAEKVRKVGKRHGKGMIGYPTTKTVTGPDYEVRG